MDAFTKLPIFQKDTHDAKEHLFILENNWTRWCVTNERIFVNEFVSTFCDEVLKWYIKLTDHPQGWTMKTWKKFKVAFKVKYQFLEARLESGNSTRVQQKIQCHSKETSRTNDRKVESIMVHLWATTKVQKSHGETISNIHQCPIGCSRDWIPKMESKHC